MEEVQGGLRLSVLYPRNAHTCMLAGMGGCGGAVEFGICEAHATLMFKIAWR